MQIPLASFLIAFGLAVFLPIDGQQGTHAMEQDTTPSNPIPSWGNLKFFWGDEEYEGETLKGKGTASSDRARFAVRMTYNWETSEGTWEADQLDALTTKPAGNTLKLYKKGDGSGTLTVVDAAHSTTKTFSFSIPDRVSFNIADAAMATFLDGQWSEKSANFQ